MDSCVSHGARGEDDAVESKGNGEWEGKSKK
jgi:hypothetical protein